MNGAEEELERRSKFLNSLIQKKKSKDPQENDEPLPFNVRVRASDMPIPIQSRAFLCARSHLDSMPGKLDSKRLALVLKKVRNFFPIWSLIRCMVRLGIALSEPVLVRTSLTPMEAFCIFQLTRFTSFFSKLQWSLWNIDTFTSTTLEKYTSIL